MKKYLVTVIVLSLLPFSPLGTHRPVQATPRTLNVAIFPYKSPKITVKIFNPLLQKIARETGISFRLVTASSRSGYAGNIRQGNYDIIFTCISCQFDTPGMGQYLYLARGKPSFTGGIIVKIDSPVKTVRDLKGQKLAAIHSQSFAGYLFARNALTDAGLHPDRDVSFRMLGKLDSVIFAVLAGSYDAGVIRTDALKDSRFMRLQSKIRIIAHSAEIPQFPFLVHRRIPVATRNAIRNAMLSMDINRPDDRAILSRMAIQGFIPAKRSDYSTIYREIKKAR